MLFVCALIYILWRMYFTEIKHQYILSQEWIFLHIKVPKENIVSSLAVETIFAQMHALHAGKTFPEIYVEGQGQLWYSLEIVSMGGKTSFIIRLPKRMRDVVESAFYTHYPEAEILEVEDYMKNFVYDPYNPGEYDIWGTEWKLAESDVIPIKTYKDFEHPTAEEKIIDPLANLFEGLAKMEPHEFFGIQILTEPLGDEEWKPRGESKIKELIGEEEEHEVKLSDIFMAPFNWFAKLKYKELLVPAHGHEKPENGPKNNWLSMTEAQKQRVTLIESKIGKPGYKTKIRFLYIAPVDKFDPMKKSIMTGAYRPLGSVMTNKVRPELKYTWTAADYRFSKTLEKPFLDLKLRRRKKNMFNGYKNRDTHMGYSPFVLNTEELATLFHFPITTEGKSMVSSIDRTVSKKVQPPSDLPIGDF